MKPDLVTIARQIEKHIPTVKTVCVPETCQIIATFSTRPDIEIDLLTPWHRLLVMRGAFDALDLTELIESVKSIEGA